MKTRLFKSQDELIEALSKSINNHNLDDNKKRLAYFNLEDLSYQIKGNYCFAICKDTVSVLTKSINSLYSLYNRDEIKVIFIVSFGENYKLKEITIF